MKTRREYYECTDLLHTKEVCIVCQNEPLYEEVWEGKFKCDCGQINEIEWRDWDSLYFTCPNCKKYYKKVGRIDDDQWIHE